MIALVVKEFELIRAFLLLVFTSLTGSRLDGLNLALELDHFVLLFLLLGFQLLNLLLQVSLAMLRLQLFPHREGHRALVERLVRSNSHFDLVTHAQKQKTSFWQIEGDLSDDLVEALGEEFFAHGTYSALSRLALHQFLIEHLSQTGHIDSRCWLVTHILNEVLSCKNKNSNHQKDAQLIL